MVRTSLNFFSFFFIHRIFDLRMLCNIQKTESDGELRKKIFTILNVDNCSFEMIFVFLFRNKYFTKLTNWYDNSHTPHKHWWWKIFQKSLFVWRKIAFDYKNKRKPQICLKHLKIRIWYIFFFLLFLWKKKWFMNCIYDYFHQIIIIMRHG